MATVMVRDSAIQSTLSNFLIFLMVAVLLFAFDVKERPTAYSAKRENSDYKDDLYSSITSGSQERQIAMVTLGVFWGIMLFRKRRLPVSFSGILYWLIFFYIAWSIMSVLWAEDYQLVSRRIVSWVILCVSAFSMSINIPLKKLPTVAFWVSLIVLGIGVFVELEAGVLSLFSGGYRFSGTMHPNSQGKNCALLLLSAAILARSDNRMSRLFAKSVIIVAFFFLVSTGSRTSFGATIIALLVYKYYGSERSKTLTYFYAIAFLFCVLFLVFGDAFMPMLGSGVQLGREESNTILGRFEVWRVCLEYARERPILGYGFHGFWTEEHAREIADAVGWGPNSAHSMYLDRLLSLGLVGLVVSLMKMMYAWWVAREGHFKKRDLGMGFALSTLTFWMVGGVLESTVTGLSFQTLLFLVVLLAIARELGMQRSRTHYHLAEPGRVIANP